MSHHLDSPQARQDARLNITDQYVFRGETGTVLILNTSSSLAGDNWIPGFHPEARYEIKIHFDGLMYEDLAYRLTFDEPGDDGRQVLAVHRLTGEDAREDLALGTRIADGRTGEVVASRDDDDTRIWAGQVVDPFYLDLNQLATFLKALDGGMMVDPDAWRPENVANSFDGASVQSIVIEIPDNSHMFTDRDIAVWSVTKLGVDTGGWRQINRFGIPMMWPMFGPREKGYTSETAAVLPADDWTARGTHVASLIAGFAGAYGTANAEAYADRLADRLLPDLLPYRISSAAEFGFAGFNGRMLSDNAAEVMFSLVANSAVSTALTPQMWADTRSNTFPYVVSV